MSALTIVLTPAMTHGCSAGAQHRRLSDRRMHATRTRSRSTLPASRRHSCKPGPFVATVAQPTKDSSAVELVPPASTAIAASFPWDAELDMEITKTPRGSRPPSVASALPHQTRKSTSQGSTRTSKCRCVTERPQLGESEPKFLQVWDVTKKQEPSYMRHTRTSRISTGHRLAHYYNVKVQREKEIQLCRGQSRAGTPGSETYKTSSAMEEDLELVSTTEDSKVVRAGEGDAPQPMSPTETQRAEIPPCNIQLEDICTGADQACDTEQVDELQEDTPTITLHHPVCWNLRPSVASWLLHTTPCQRRPAAWKIGESPPVAGAYHGKVEYEEDIHVRGGQNQGDATALRTKADSGLMSTDKRDVSTTPQSVINSAVVQPGQVLQQSMCTITKWTDDLKPGDAIQTDKLAEASPNSPDCWKLCPSIASGMLHPAAGTRLAAPKFSKSSIAAVGNAKVQRGKHTLICGDQCKQSPLDPTSVAFEGDHGAIDGFQEDTFARASQRVPDCWYLWPSTASWLLHPMQRQRLAPVEICKLSAASPAGLEQEQTQAPQGSPVELLDWYLRPSVGTWFMTLLPSKGKQELRSAPHASHKHYPPLTALALRPLPTWFGSQPHPPARPPSHAAIGPPPFPACTKNMKFKDLPFTSSASKSKASSRVECDMTNRSFCNSQQGRAKILPPLPPAPGKKRQTLTVSSQTQMTQPRHDSCPSNHPRVSLFSSWHSKPCADGHMQEDLQWHDVALALVAQQQSSSVCSKAAQAAASAFVCRPSVGTWLRKPMLGPAQFRALAEMSALTPMARTMTKQNQNSARLFGRLALHCAARDGKQSVVQMLLAARTDPGAAVERGITPLHLAAEAGHDEVVRLLLEVRASPHSATSGCSLGTQGITPLHAAACCGCVSVTMRLLTASASPAQARGDDVLPLHFAAQGGHVNVTLVLLAAQSPVDQAGAGGFTPLHDSAHGGHLDVVAALLAARASSNVATQGGTTPLHGAAQGGHADVSMCLLVNGAAHSISSIGGFTPLHDAAHAGHKAVVRQLVYANASPHVRSAEGATPLHLAAQAGWTKIAAFLAKACAKAGYESLNDSTGSVASPLRLAASKGHLNVVRALRSRQ